MPTVYTGVGSRKTPEHILDLMFALDGHFREKGWILRSGGAAGADLSFELGAGDLKEIYRPEDATPEAMELAGRYHPAWYRCSSYARALHGRNVFQVLGRDMKTPSKFLICWTPDGAISHDERTLRTGGTGTAISIASTFGVPIFNLAYPDHFKKFMDLLSR